MVGKFRVRYNSVRNERQRRRMYFAFLGTQEIIIILVVALLVFGPQKLPEIGRQVGSALRELNRMRGDVQRAFDIDEFTRDHTSDYTAPRYDAVAPYGTTYPASGNGYSDTYDNNHTLESAEQSVASAQHDFHAAETETVNASPLYAGNSSLPHPPGPPNAYHGTEPMVSPVAINTSTTEPSPAVAALSQSGTTSKE